MSATTTRLPAVLPPCPVMRFSVDDYHRMLATGVLMDGDPYELVEGWIVPKMPQDPIHAGTLELAAEVLRAYIPAGWSVRSQVPVTTSDSEPEPDVAVVRGRTVDYLKRHPAPADVALLVEVANTSLEFDRRLKARIYARAGIPAYWILDVNARRIEAFTDPDATTDEPSYRTQRTASVGEALPLILSGATVAEVPVADLLPTGG